MSDQPDRDLAPSFAELRDGREREAGTFRAAVARGRVRNQARSAWLRRRLTVALATAVPLVAVLTVQLLDEAQEREALEIARQAESILEWRSPTDMLMHNAYADWLGAMPTIGSPIPNTTTLPEGGSQ
jgi:hypothetical protein